MAAAALVVAPTAGAAGDGANFVPDGTYCEGATCITVSPTSIVTAARYNLADEFGRMGNWTITNYAYPGVFTPAAYEHAGVPETQASIAGRVNIDGTMSARNVSAYVANPPAPALALERYCTDFTTQPRGILSSKPPRNVGRLDSGDAAMQLCGFTERQPDGGNYFLVDPWKPRSCSNPEKTWLVNPELPLSATNPLREESALINNCVSTHKPAAAKVAKCAAVKYGKKKVAVTSTGVGCIGARNMIAKYLRAGVEAKGWDCTEKRVGKARVATCVNGKLKVVGSWRA